MKVFVEVRYVDVLTPATAATYKRRSDAFDLVIDFRHGEPARAGFASVIERWLAHLIGVEVAVTPIARLDRMWRWFVGLDAEGTKIGNALWRDESPPTGGPNRLVALFKLDFASEHVKLESMAGEPVYLVLGMTGGNTIRVKPQNLIGGLPIKVPATSL